METPVALASTLLHNLLHLASVVCRVDDGQHDAGPLCFAGRPGEHLRLRRLPLREQHEVLFFECIFDKLQFYFFLLEILN
jgi:hypothetical protein